MENQTEVKPAEVSAEDKAKAAIENQLSVINVVEGLFNAMQAGSFPVRAMQAASNGMSFLAQFHKQLLGQLPPATLEELKKRNAPVQAAEVKPVEAANGQQA